VAQEMVMQEKFVEARTQKRVYLHDQQLRC